VDILQKRLSAVLQKENKVVEFEGQPQRAVCLLTAQPTAREV
jgi:hypothetical protein